MLVEFTLKGTKPLLMHADDVEWADLVTRWRLDPANKKKQGESSGDDRRPGFSWVGYLYHSETHVAMPAMNLSACLRKAGSRVPMGQRGKTLKEGAVSGIQFTDEFLDFTVKGKPISFAPFTALCEKNDFAEHVEAVKKFGFKLDVRRACVGTSKHIRVRPRFDLWEVSGRFEVITPEITRDLLETLFQQAGKVGLGDWRPGGKTPGPYGMFDSELKFTK